ncbi:site-specific DNA-methyltransferase [Mammaliicoccus sciuri]|uniref:site-specific DNA-methyltransferase n=3 Tax=Mammaliicoccus sciuri TaxID=1296 RepID=UPI00194DD65B|nr:site-specific DNA-methyltransferase [Mammaliicoccus sciuri]
METKLQQEINKVLKVFPKYWQGETLLKNNLIEDIRSYNEKTIEALLSNNLIKDTYALQLPSGSVFKTEDFISMLLFKNYWDNSYTKYSNEIGLTSDSKYLSYNTDVVLDFPHKDSVLEGGMTKEDVGKREVYYHNILAKEEIDTLLSPKVLTKAKKYDKHGAHYIDSIEATDNLILKGNNLVALHTLKKKYEGKVKLIYIDPPYNTGNDSFRYNDSFNRSTWLTFMRNRLEIAKALLSEDGLIFVEIDKNEEAYLKVLMDEIFNEQMFVNNITVQSSTASGNKTAHKDKTIIKTKDSILVYKKKENINIFPQYSIQDKWDTHFNSILIPEGNSYKVESLKKFMIDNNIINHNFVINEGAINNTSFLSFVFENRDYIFTTKSSLPRHVKIESLQKVDEVIKYESTNGETQYALNGRRLGFLKNNIKNIDGVEQIAKLVTDIWTDINFNNTQNEGGVSLPSGKKPEYLLKRILELVTEPGDTVLDFFMGASTTQAVAHKMNRQYIGIEQMDYINTTSIPRLKKVIEGEQSGVSKVVQWQGGGSFVYAELYSLNEEYLHRIQACQKIEELEYVIDIMKHSAYLNFKVDLDKVTTHNESFKSLSLDEQKDVLIQVLDMNQLYLNYSEIEDSQYNISDSVKAFNHSFYQREGDKNE